MGQKRGKFINRLSLSLVSATFVTSAGIVAVSINSSNGDTGQSNQVVQPNNSNTTQGTGNIGIQGNHNNVVPGNNNVIHSNPSTVNGRQINNPSIYTEKLNGRQINNPNTYTENDNRNQSNVNCNGGNYKKSICGNVGTANFSGD
ncbi:MAG: hypothetical protein RMY30_038225 [Nostoc sp. CmiSLP01]|nr:hypothetical protein [Nostoc sp. CmiSLP01]MDZ8287566.1 hypothetical protein [Nostoc sp. ChiSLP01]